MRSMKTVATRLYKLEVRFGVEAMRRAAAPSADEMIFERLVAGEWECAMKLLELPEQDPLKEWESNGPRATGLIRELDIDFRNLPLLRQTFSRSLADLPPELRWDIPQKLIEADAE